MPPELAFKPGDLVRARGREWVVLPETREDLLRLRPLGGAEGDATLIYLPLEPERPAPATFEPPHADSHGSLAAALLLRDALRLKLRAGAGPFRSFGNLNVEPRAYQLVPLLMALKLDPIRLLVADDVGIGKTIEAGLIARELLDRGEIKRLVVVCPPHLCDQWQAELAEKFGIDAEVVRTGTATRLERGLRPDESVFEVYPYTIVSLDYIKSDRRRSDFLRACPEFVIVDEAHTCVSANTNTRHQRYQLLKGLAEGDSRRAMVLLTATPHSGDDTAFHNLLGLLDPKFSALAEMPDGDERRTLREELALHLVQRRRGDIAEWRDDTRFPVRESREATYRLTGDWGRLVDHVLDYARGMVRRAEGGTKLEQRMSWWAALALLRCVSSSPAAASLALRTRLEAAAGDNDDDALAKLDRAARETVMDEATDDLLVLTETAPAGTVDDPEGTEALRELIAEADGLRGPRKDPKLGVLTREIQRLIEAGFAPVVFCRYIATAHYVGEQLKAALGRKRRNPTHILVVTGELTPDQREERIEALGELDDGVTPVLVATDCLSEGVNLQRHFNAVVHYDLTWNPTRHEQREGRADRFGQASPVVRALMIYGRDNPVDGAVLRVIVRKAEKIRQELGVSVPMPADNNKVVDAIMRAVLLHGGTDAGQRELDLGLAETETAVDDAWQTAKDKVSRTVFAQRRLTPEDVWPEWKKATSVLGGHDDVKRFVRLSAERLGAALDRRKDHWRLPVPHLPKPLQDRLEAIGFRESAKLVFDPRAQGRANFIHRTHPLVSVLADYVAEQALDQGGKGPGFRYGAAQPTPRGAAYVAEGSPGYGAPSISARASAAFARGIGARTVLYLLRLRCQLQLERRGGNGGYAPVRSLLAEECLGVAVRSGGAPELLAEEEALSLLSLEPGRNMAGGQKTHLVRQALDELTALEPEFERLARERARQLLADHRRIRDASGIRGERYQVIPALPVDTIGVYVFLPMASL